MSLASKFGIKPELLPTPSVYCTDNRRVGIEIEQEYRTEQQYRKCQEVMSDKYWTVKGDGSLRHFGVEFCSNILYPGDVDAALDQVFDYLQAGTFSWRTGIHVHIDVSDLDEAQIRSVCELYAVVEPVLFEWEGNERDQSRFCVPWYTCPAAVRAMLSQLDGDEFAVREAFERFGKYSALNLTSIPRFGTIEFRHMQTVNDKEKLRKYVNICLAIVEAGKEKINAGQMLSMNGAENFIRATFDKSLSFLDGTPVDFDRAWQSIDVINNIKMSTIPQRRKKKQMNDDVFMKRVLQATKRGVK